jgi:AcrR family transcriptional regulator
MKAEAVRRPSQPRQSAPRAPGNVTQARDRRDSRWDEHRRARREELVQATLTAVARHGAGVGMDEIAAAAGTSKTVVYRHFADRSQLYVAVCTEVAERLLAQLRTAMETSGSPRAMTAAAISTYLAFLEAEPEVYRFVVSQHPAEDADPIANLADLVGDEAATLMALALDRAGRDPGPADAWGHGRVGMVRSAADWWLRAGRPMPRTELAAHLTDLAWAGLSGVVAPAPHRLEET